MTGRAGGRVLFRGQPDQLRALQNLWQDNHVIEEKLVRLGVDANGMHGDLQVILSCLRRMTAILALLERSGL